MVKKLKVLIIKTFLLFKIKKKIEKMNGRKSNTKKRSNRFCFIKRNV